MEVQFTLNGKKVSTEIAADTVLLNLLRDLGCKSVNVDARQQTVVCVQYGSTENPVCHVLFLQQALTDMK